MAIDPASAQAYGQLTACFTYLTQPDSAKKYLAITDKLDPMAIDSELRQLMTKK